MTGTEQRSATTVEVPAPAIDMKLEIVVIPVSDVDRAKAFYARLGWRLDADFASDESKWITGETLLIAGGLR